MTGSWAAMKKTASDNGREREKERGRREGGREREYICV